MNIKDWGIEVHECAKANGWWDNKDRNPGEIYMNIASEVSEAWEEWRQDNSPIYTTDGKPEGELIELADAVIRIMDYCQFHGWDLEKAMQIKHEYNKTRAYRHGWLRA